MGGLAGMRWGHAQVMVAPHDWRCTCGIGLGRSRRAARIRMQEHREDLRQDAQDYIARHRR